MSRPVAGEFRDLPLPDTSAIERQVLCDLVNSPEVLPEVQSLVRREFFTEPSRARIWDVIMSLFNERENIDLPSVYSRAGKDFMEEVISRSLEPATPSVAYGHARLLRDAAVQPRDSVIVRWQTAYLPVHDTTYLRDTLHTIDSVLVDVPISEKGYASENYRVTIRGYRAEMTDIWIRQKETFVAVPYRKHWSWTLGPQLGVGFTPKGFQPYAGVGATFGYSF